MANKPVAMQFIAVVRTRPNTEVTGGAAYPEYSSADDTGVVVRAGTYNRPPNPGETVFTSERAALSAAMSVNQKMQVGMGQNCRITVYGKPCGTVPANAARQFAAGETDEKVYAEVDTVSAGLHDAVRFANKVPDAASIVVRSMAGPEADMTLEAASGA